MSRCQKALASLARRRGKLGITIVPDPANVSKSRSMPAVLPPRLYLTKIPFRTHPASAKMLPHLFCQHILLTAARTERHRRWDAAIRGLRLFETL